MSQQPLKKPMEEQCGLSRRYGSNYIMSSFIISDHHLIFGLLGDSIEDDEMEGTGSTNGGGEKCISFGRRTSRNETTWET
jgi:hypothetical protein